MRAALRWVQPALAVLAGIFIVALLASQWQELRAYDWQITPAWLLASVLLMLAAWAVEIRLWQGLLKALGGRLAYGAAARIWFLSAVVRYVPGNIWQPLSMTLYAQQHAVRAEITVTSVALYQGIILLAAAPVAAVYFWGTGNWGLLTDVIGSLATPLILLALAPVVIFLLWPHLLIHALDWLLAKAGRPALGTGLGRATLFAAIVVAAIDWLLWGASFAALTFGIQHFAPAEMAALAPHLIASYAIAYCIGFLSFITPSGFGVREGALYVLLAPLLGGGPVTVAALAMRLWTMLGEVIMALLSAATRRSAQPVPLLNEEPG